MLHVVLYQPEIPPNTGNIARQCIGMKAALHIIRPCSFDLGAKAVKRAGLDYWNELNLTLHDCSDDFLKWLGNRRPWLVTRHGEVRYDTAGYKDDDVIIFGSETRGLPEEWRAVWGARSVYVPIIGNVRSYNLANTVSIVLAQASLMAGMYEAP